MFAGAHDQLRLGSVRCRGSNDALRERRRVEVAMAHFDITNLCLPRQALLIARRVAPPVRMGSEQRVRDFAEALKADLLGKLRGVHRPWLHGNAASAEAVLFLDEAELAACLIRDWLRNQVRDHWWWRYVLGSLPASDWLRRNVLTRGDVLATVTDLLASTEWAVAWYLRMDAAGISRAWRALSDTYGIEWRGAAAVPGVHRVSRIFHGEGDDEPDHEQGAAALTTLLRLVPEVGSRLLPAPARQLFAATLLARRRLQWARSPALAQALEVCGYDEVIAQVARRLSWIAASNSSESASSPVMQQADAAPAGRIGIPAAEFPAMMGIATRRYDSNRVAAPGSGARNVRLPPARSSTAPTRTQATERRRMLVEGSTHQQVFPPAAHVSGDPVGTIPALSSEQALPASVSGRANAAYAHVPPPESSVAPIATSFGGIFYLLNAALALGFYGDFTAPRHRGIDLSPWDWLAAMGRRWFGTAFRKDPLWKALAELAGHAPRHRPERGFRPPKEGALRGAATTIEGWFADSSARLVGRLASALGAEDPQTVQGLVCRHRAHLYMSATCVDVHFTMAELPIAVRVAGLDRDPGWIPAAGRSVRFHFE